MQYGKRIFSSAMAFVLCFSLMGAPAFAVGEELEQPEKAADIVEPVPASGKAVQPAVPEAEFEPTAEPADAESPIEAKSVEDVIDFVYVDQTIVGVGDEQNIAFGLKDGAQIESATLVLQRTDTGAVVEFAATVIVEDAALFTFSFDDEADVAAYALAGIRYVADGEETLVEFTSAQIAAAEVTEEGEVLAIAVSESSSCPYAFDVVSSALAGAIEQAPVSADEIVAYAIDENGELTAHATVQEALEVADEGGQAAADYHEALAEEATQAAEEAQSDDASPLDQAVALLVPEKAYAASNGVFVVGLDPGHGGYDSGAVGYGLEECDINWKIAVYCQAELNTYHNVTAVLSRTENECPGLSERVDRLVSAGAKVVVSLHNNASGAGTGYGSEVWVPNDSSYKYEETHVVGEQLGTKILDKLVALGLNKRGVFTRNAIEKGYEYEETHYPDGSLSDYYSVIDASRRYGIPGIIVEHAFIDNANDAAFLAKDSNLKKLGIADAKGIAEQYGLTKTTEDQKYLIMGDSQTTIVQMASWYKANGATYPSATYKQYGAETIDDFCRILYEEASTEGVRAEVVFAQAMLETGWLKFGGDVKAEQCNFCGLGATGGGVGGASFNTYGTDSVRMGLRAQVQHLKAYASSDNLVNEKVDPRFTYVTRGCAPRVDDLAGKWAADTSYGTKLKKLIDSLLAHQVPAAGTTLSLSQAEMKDASSVYVDGIEYPVTWGNGAATIVLPDTSRQVLQVYEFNKQSKDLETVYPTHMYVWFLTYGNGGYVMSRAEDFDDIMEYVGSSIRVMGKKGIRMITAVPTDKKTVMTTKNMDGYTLLEYGTVVARDSKLDGASLTLTTSGAASNYAYKKDVADPVFKQADGYTQYTNVLVGFSMDECKELLTMRSYMKIADSEGNEMVLYGGPVHRSIGYIAYQNKNAFKSSTAAYAYVWDIIHAVYGADKK